MNINKAIEKICSKYEGWMGYASSQKEINNLDKEMVKIIKLIRKLQGENIVYKDIITEITKKVRKNEEVNFKEIIANLSAQYKEEEKEVE